MMKTRPPKDAASKVKDSHLPEQLPASWLTGRPKTRRAARAGWVLTGLLGIMLLVLTAPRVLTPSTPVTLSASGDTYLKQGTPNTNQGNETLLRIQPSGDNRVLVKFDQQVLEQAVGNSGIRSAKLRLYLVTNGNNWGADGR
ncbi:MAG: hypothetical protein L0387_06890, partial [Acidobacteria bacterium]|nr:hypothetical protein [Acidobacteriota bacterium]